MTRKASVPIERTHVNVLAKDLGISILDAGPKQRLGLTPDLTQYSPSESRTIMQGLDKKGLVFSMHLVIERIRGAFREYFCLVISMFVSCSWCC
jgi:hypothetical protein